MGKPVSVKHLSTQLCFTKLNSRVLEKKDSMGFFEISRQTLQENQQNQLTETHKSSQRLNRQPGSLHVTYLCPLDICYAYVLGLLVDPISVEAGLNLSSFGDPYPDWYISQSIQLDYLDLSISLGGLPSTEEKLRGLGWGEWCKEGMVCEEEGKEEAGKTAVGWLNK